MITADDASPAVVIVLFAWSVVVVITADDASPIVVVTALDVARQS